MNYINNIFENDYNLNNLIKINPRGYEFDLYITPRFLNHYKYTIYEPATSSIAYKRAINIHTFIDVGAHFGFFDILVGRKNQNCKIIAFEPIPENYEILKKNIELNRIENIRLFQMAVSNEEGIRQFEVSEASDNSGFIANPNARVLKKILVNVVVLNQLINEISNKPLLVKIDTEGSEIRVIEGMKKLIAEMDQMEIITEFNPKCLSSNGFDPKILLETISESGFTIFFIHEEEGACEIYEKRFSWKEFIKDKSYKNLYCIKTKNIEKMEHDLNIPIVYKKSIRSSPFLPVKEKEHNTNDHFNKRSTKSLNVSSDIKSSQDSRVKKILFVNHNLFPFEVSGTPLSTMNHAQGMARKGLEVGVLIPSFKISDGFGKEKLKDFTLYQVPAINKYKAFIGDLQKREISKYRRTISKIINDFSPQMVHINDYVFMPAEIIDILHKNGCIIIRNVCNCEEFCHRDYPVIPSKFQNKLCLGPENPHKCAHCFMSDQTIGPGREIYYGSIKFVEKKIEQRHEYIKRLYRNVIDQVIFTSNSFKTFFNKFVPIDEEKIAIIPRGFEFDFKREEIPKKNFGDLVHFGFIGNIIPSKGIDVMLKAFEIISEDYEFFLHIFGELNDKGYLQWMKILQDRYPEKFKYEGSFRKDDLLKIAQSIDICITPSYFDTYNRVVREFLYLGIPVIATDFFGSFIINDNKNGFKIPVGDVSALAEKMIKIIREPTLLKDLSIGAWHTKIPSLEEETESLIEIYNYLYMNVLKKKSGRSIKKFIEPWDLIHLLKRKIGQSHFPLHNSTPKNNKKWRED